MSVSDAQRLLELSERLGALQYGEFTLSSGDKSHYYFDGRLVTLDAEGAYLVGRAFEPIVRASGAEAIAGPAVAAVPMLAAISVASHIQGAPVPGLIVRSERKAYGTGKLIEGRCGRECRLPWSTTRATRAAASCTRSTPLKRRGVA